MKKIDLKNVTLYGADTIDINRLLKVFEICTESVDFGEKIIFADVESEYKTDSGIRVIPAPIESLSDYNFFNLIGLNDYIETDFVMVVEWDGFILNPSSWDQKFLEYDYIGAPWYVNDDFWFEDYDFPKSLKGKRVVGNGGFSIRSKKFIETTARLVKDGALSKYYSPTGPLKDYFAEDLVTCVYERELMEKEGLKFAPYEVAKRFSIEGDDEVYSNQFGFHQLKWTDISDWINKNPQWGIKQIPIE